MERTNNSIWDFYIEVVEGLLDLDYNTEATSLLSEAFKEAKLLEDVDPVLTSTTLRHVRQLIARDKNFHAQSLLRSLLDAQISVLGSSHPDVRQTMQLFSSMELVNDAGRTSLAS
ncbi:MAG: hypothetical protein K8F91_03105 [Candidatus Obscuribacterales bacterium]|nr:hypothetical protein [Candidatus Obscuribacterales bacterium]